MKVKFSLLAWALLTLASSVPGHAHVVSPRSVGSAHRINFGPELNHRTFNAPSIKKFGTFTTSDAADPKEIAIKFVKSKLHPKAEFVIRDIYKSDHNGVTHVYLKQVVNGLYVTNGDINVNVDQFGRVISYGDSFVKPNANANRPMGPIKITKDGVKINLISEGVQYVFDEHDTIFLKSPSTDSSSNSVTYSINSEIGPVISPEEALNSLAHFINQEIPHPENIKYTEVGTLEGTESFILLTNVPFALSDVKMSQSYIQLDDQTLQLVWDIQVEMEDNWYNAHINANNGELIALMDWVSDAMYNVFPLGTNDPSDGSRQILENPYDIIASPLGWHSQDKKNYTNTIGNNVYAHENLKGKYDWENNYRPEGGSLLAFDFPLDLTQAPKTYIDASVTNLFYWNNLIHDLFYRYGFNEVAGNFQQYNNGKGGRDKDAVVANAQDGSGFNNANFATPPDGQHGKMRMYVWDVIDPWRDGDLESGIVIHEYAHGISTRLTGGPLNSNCLGWGEAGGMGEGWGDFFATILRMNSSNDRNSEFGMGDWANGGEGIRRYPYSTSFKTNPELFSYLDKPGYWGVHAKGAVWAEILYEVYWNLVDKYGFTPDWFPPVLDKNTPPSSSDWYSSASKPNKLIPRHGNTLTLQLVVDGLKLQPCRPLFIDARDSIIQADEILTGGENLCEIWRGFAKRGLGVKAKVIGGSPWGGGVHKDSFKD
ncbi:17313_t:CDS:2 [Cetraspora pellucida]|uniref:17313_t:CDS:1 n=1 Tax=Cetraspora pellucida TaxID=1433469 RepID=A0ACA9LC15_9GLOM|nr:17313_t:CDS:2 [Cetraspora pellucida]